MRPTDDDNPPFVLLTAFEPSGDALGAALVQQLRQQRPGLAIYALGGPKLRAAGATIIEETTGKPVMLLGAITQAREHFQRVSRVKTWLRGRRVLAHVPIDSPAANWSYCKLIRAHDPTIPIVHLAAPQLWAWAPWRIHKLRRLTNHVLCLLPFEPDWFSKRSVPATFVGHPMFDAYLGRSEAYGHHVPSADIGAPALPGPGPSGVRLGLLPGSRPGEWAKNWATMLRVFVDLKARHPGLVGCIAGYNERTQPALESITQATIPGLKGFPEGLTLVQKRTPEVLAWSDAVLAVSGTATLEVAMHQKPMAVLYNGNMLAWRLAGQFLIRTRTFSLPNIIHEWQAGVRAVPEFVPHNADPKPVTQALEPLLFDAQARSSAVNRLDQVCAAFRDASFIERAPATFLKVTGL